MFESDSISSTDSTKDDAHDVPNLRPPSSRFRRRPKWEKRLPKRFVVAATPGSNSLELGIAIQTTDTGATHTTKALLDCGATDLFIDTAFVARNRLTTKVLSRPIPVYNVDGSPNEAGSISEIVDLILRYRDHSERATFAVTNLGKQDIILGLTWLREHNPEVDWQSGEVKMSRCLNHCRTCQHEANTERKIRIAEEVKLRRCRSGPMPSPDLDMKDIPDLAPDSDENGDDEEPVSGDDALEDDDRLFFTAIPCEDKFIRATSNISQ